MNIRRLEDKVVGFHIVSRENLGIAPLASDMTRIPDFPPGAPSTRGTSMTYSYSIANPHRGAPVTGKREFLFFLVLGILGLEGDILGGIELVLLGTK
jgi:hypothetical protein